MIEQPTMKPRYRAIARFPEKLRGRKTLDPSLVTTIGLPQKELDQEKIF
jgi:hypothetical protein